jgi:cytochrome bd ubiquinol oxidase subunit II
MMETLWFCLLVFMFGTYVVLGGTDLGVGILHLFVARNETERQQVIRSIRPVWKPNEVWLVASGGTLFLAFPSALAVSFSGFYLALMLVLWLLVLRGLGLELRYHVPDVLWRQFWDVAVSGSSLLLALCLGAALGNVVRGVPLDEHGVFFEPLWTNFRVGDQTGILDWYTVLVGLVAVVVLAHHGALWLNATLNGEVRERANRLASRLGVVLIVLLVALDGASFVARPEFRDGLFARPWGVLFPVGALAGLVMTFVWRRGRAWRAYFASCAALYTLLGTATVSIYPNILPSRIPEYALSIKKTAAPLAGLEAALYWWIPGIVIVGAYFAYIYAKLPRFINDHE